MYELAATPSSTADGVLPPEKRVVFAPLLEATLAALMPPNEREAAAIAQLGLPLGGLLPAYEALPYLAVFDAAANSRFREFTEHERYSRTAQLVLKHYGETMIGRALYILLRTLGPERASLRLHRNLRTLGILADAEVRPQGERHHLARIDRPGRVGIYQGFIIGMLSISGARRPSADLLSYEAGIASFDVRWE